MLKNKLKLINPQLVIFDLDGLLIDSEPLWRIAEINVFKKHGIFLTDDDCAKFQGSRIEEAVPMVFERFNVKVFDELSVVNEIIDQVFILFENVEIMQGVYEVINFFENRNISMAIASSSKMLLIEKAIERLKIKEKISMLHSAEFEIAGKPEPYVFQTVARKFGVDSDKCLVFEDSILGVQAAKKAQMNVVAVPLPENYEDENYKLADFKVHSLLEWLEIFG